MVIRSFKNKETELFFIKGSLPRKKGWASVHKIARRKLDILQYAKELRDLMNPPSNHFEILRGDLKGYYSIRINDQWRVVFSWDNQPFDVRIMDYH